MMGGHRSCTTAFSHAGRVFSVTPRQSIRNSFSCCSRMRAIRGTLATPPLPSTKPGAVKPCHVRHPSVVRSNATLHFGILLSNCASVDARVKFDTPSHPVPFLPPTKKKGRENLQPGVRSRTGRTKMLTWKKMKLGWKIWNVECHFLHGSCHQRTEEVQLKMVSENKYGACPRALGKSAVYSCQGHSSKHR